MNEVSEVGTEEPEEADPAAVVDKNETDEQLSGQMSVQDVPEILPEKKNTEVQMDIDIALEIVQSLPSLYPLQNLEEEAVLRVISELRRRENI